MTPKIFFTRLSGFTFSMSTTENPTYPLANLLTYNPTEEWHGGSTAGGQYLQIDFGQDVAKNYILIDNHNISTIDGFKVESSDSSSMTSPVTLVADNTPADDLMLIAEFTTDLKRYVRITFTGSNPLAEAPKIGNLFMGAVFQFQHPYDFGHAAGQKQFTTSLGTSLSGVRRGSQPYPGRRQYAFPWSLIDDAEVADIMIINDICQGSLLPFYLQWHEDFDVRLVRFKKDYQAYRSRSYLLNNADGSLEMEEALATDDVSTNDQYAGQSLVFAVPLPGA